MGFGIARTARSRKAKAGVRALFGRAPPASEVGDRLGRLAKRMLGRSVIDASPKRLTVQFHPFAAPGTIVVLADGDLEIKIETFALGAGFHAHVLSQLGSLLDELDFVWADREDAPARMLDHLAERLRAGATSIAMPADRTFVFDGILTSMGPRDAAWRDRVIADPRAGTDAFAWWSTDRGSRARADALLAMWHEVPWRPPLDEDEREIMRRVDRDLRSALSYVSPARISRAGDPTGGVPRTPRDQSDRVQGSALTTGIVELPYADWALLLDLLEIDDEIANQVRAKANGTPTIGYRRYDVIAELDGWSLRVPGSFLGGWRDDVYIATDGERSMELATITVDSDQNAEQLLAIAPERFPVIDRHATGRAEAYDEHGMRVIHGLVADPPHVAILTAKGPEPWGLAMWRSLTRVSRSSD